MNRFPSLESLILRTLEEQGEMRPPEGRLAEEYFWLAAAQLQARGLVTADQRAGVVRKSAAAYHPEPLEDLADSVTRAELLVKRWRQIAEMRGGSEGAVYLQTAIDLEDALEETQPPARPEELGCLHFSRVCIGPDARPEKEPSICRLCGRSQLNHPGQPGINPATAKPFLAYPWEMV